MRVIEERFINSSKIEEKEEEPQAERFFKLSSRN